jgi:hypothetical protein
MPSIADVILLVRGIARGERLVIGPAVKQYGSFRLYSYSISLKGGHLLNPSKYILAVGDLPAPLSFRLGSGNFLSVFYTNRERLLGECVYLGDIPLSKSTSHDVYDYTRRWLRNKQAAIDCFDTQIAKLTVAPENKYRQRQMYQGIVSRMAVRYQLVNDAFRDLIPDHSDAAIATKRDVASDERESRRIRRRFRWYFMFYNWYLGR